MGIRSQAFSGVVLTGDDAEIFRNQVVYGRPKRAAVETVKRGQTIASALKKDGAIAFTVIGTQGIARRK
jgi:hypothetical protein